MSLGLQSLVDVVEGRTEELFLLWQKLITQCDEAKQKLGLLKEHGDRYRDQMQARLREGVAANATMNFMGFIGQIDDVVAKQEGEVARLEEACKQQWQELAAARREMRVYEILRDRMSAKKMEAELKRSQAEIEELLQKVTKPL